MRETPSVYFIGDVAIDDYFDADRWPGIADKAYVRPGDSLVGGMIANAACVFAGLGGRPEFISLLNTSPLSQHLCAALNDRGVSTRHMLHDVEMADSRNLIFLVGGEHVVLTVDIGRAPMVMGDAAITELLKPGYLYTTLNRARRLRAGDLSGPALMAELRRRGRRLVFDLDVEGFAGEDADYVRAAEVLIMNEIGFDLSFGAAGLAEINDWMQRYQVRTIIRTLAADGAEAFDGFERTKIDGYRVPVVDVTGAGDTFGGALVYALCQDHALKPALELAIAAASRAVTVHGPQGGIATLDEIERFRRDAVRG